MFKNNFRVFNTLLKYINISRNIKKITIYNNFLENKLDIYLKRNIY